MTHAVPATASAACGVYAHASAYLLENIRRVALQNYSAWQNVELVTDAGVNKLAFKVLHACTGCARWKRPTLLPRKRRAGPSLRLAPHCTNTLYKAVRVQTYNFRSVAQSQLDCHKHEYSALVKCLCNLFIKCSVFVNITEHFKNTQTARVTTRTSSVAYHMFQRHGLRHPAAVCSTTYTHAEASCLSTASCEAKEPPHIVLMCFLYLEILILLSCHVYRNLMELNFSWQCVV